MRFSLFCIILFASSMQLRATMPLDACYRKTLKPLGKNVLFMQFREEGMREGHYFEPWQFQKYETGGQIFCNGTGFAKRDTIYDASSKSYSLTQYNSKHLLYKDYGSDGQLPVTAEMFGQQPYMLARYSPFILLQYFMDQGIISCSPDADNNWCMYQTRIQQSEVSIYIDISQKLLYRVEIKSHHEQYGDITENIYYEDYTQLNEQVYYPRHIRIERLNGRITEQVHITEAAIQKKMPRLLTLPKDYAFWQPPAQEKTIHSRQFSEHIWLIELSHTDDRVLLAEFSDFLLIAEAPLNSSNGEDIIAEARKLFPGKPIRYFVAGHHHPHYTGGLRAFVHQGAQIICNAQNREYIRYLAEAPHTLQPDSLQLEPAPLQLLELNDSLLISDGSFRMVIYFIGALSKHTSDYMICYFPEEKILFQDDLVWIPARGTPAAAGEQQAGLYEAIKKLGIEPHTIIQSWPVHDYNIKTIIPFRELEESVRLRQNNSNR